MSRRNANLAHVERAQNLKAEAQAKARQEDAHRQAAKAETVALAEARGTEFEQPEQKRGETAKPMRRISGLVWLNNKGRLGSGAERVDRLAAGIRYAQAYSTASGEVPIRSILNRDITGGEGPTVQGLKDSATARANAKLKLEMYQSQLGKLVSLIEACDIVCGIGMTPREACRDGHDATKMEARLIVALDLLRAASGMRRPDAPQHTAG